MVRQGGHSCRQLVDATCTFKLDGSIRVEEQIVVARRQCDHVGVWHERGGEDPQRSRRTVGRFDLLNEWLGEVRTHETGEISVLTHRHVATSTTTLTTATARTLSNIGSF